MPGFSPQQRETAQDLTEAPLFRQAGPLARQALLESGIVESGLSDHAHEAGSDSEGVLAQRASQGWGTVAEENNPTSAAQMFLQHAIGKEHQFKDAGSLAQAVQGSAYPLRYGEHAKEAQGLLQGLLGASKGTGAVQGRNALTASTTASQGGPTAAELQEVLGAVKSLSAPAIAAAGVSPGRPAFSAGPVLPEGSKPVPGLTPVQSGTSSAQQLLERVLGGAQNPNVESKVTQGGGEPSSGGYVNPLPGFTKGRTDQGVDYSARPGAPIKAVGNGRVLGISPDWYKGQPYVSYELTDGPRKGQVMYVAEQITPRVKAGDRVSAGQTIGVYAPSGTGIETGLGTRTGGQTLAKATSGYTEGQETAAGKQVRKFLEQLGAR